MVRKRQRDGLLHLLLADHLTPHCHALADAAFAATHGAMPARLGKLPQPLFDGGSFDPQLISPLAHIPDAHPAKLTEACMRAFVATDDGIFIEAAGLVQPVVTH